MRNNARRILASTPQSCATTNHAIFENIRPSKVLLLVIKRFITYLCLSYI